MTTQPEHWSRRTYYSAVRDSDDEVWAATDRILEHECPKCHAAPGQWCEYVTYHPGQFDTLHVARVRKAAAA